MYHKVRVGDVIENEKQNFLNKTYPQHCTIANVKSGVIQGEGKEGGGGGAL